MLSLFSVKKIWKLCKKNLRKDAIILIIWICACLDLFFISFCVLCSCFIEFTVQMCNVSVYVLFIFNSFLFFFWWWCKIQKKHKKTNKTPLRLCQDRRPIDLVDIVEMVVTASPKHCWANRTDDLIYANAYDGPPAFSSGSSMPPAFWLFCIYCCFVVYTWIITLFI